MDNLTHTLFGATLARTPLGRAGRGTTAALLLASNAPDLDVVSAAGGTMSYLHWHRGPTHGLLGVIGLGVLTAGVVWGWNTIADRRPATRPRPAAASFGALVAIAMLGVALHILMDLATSYGTRIFSPFDWHWYAYDWLPIVDIYLLVALALGLLFGTIADGRQPTGARRVVSARSRLAAVVLVLMAIDYGLRATAHHAALARAPLLFGRLLPPACHPQLPLSQGQLAVWPAAGGASRPGSAPSGQPCLVEFAAVPTFLSPFRWRVITHLSNAYELHDVALVAAGGGGGATDDEAWRVAVRFPDQWTPATREAATAPMAQIFLGFSRFPAARTFTEPSGTTVRWTDVRFAGGITSLQDRSRRPDPFNLMVRLDAAGHVVEQRAGR